MARIYTKTGDDGTTSLIGKRIAKHSLRVEAYGTVDELNTFIGQIIAQGVGKDMAARLLEIQKDLFMIGADLADIDSKLSINMKPESIKCLENWIDHLTGQLPPLTAFILPGGSMAASTMHVARTVCRRAERTVSMLAEDEYIYPVIMPYLNRLSDLLFMMARYQNMQDGRDDIKWNPEV